MPRDRRGPPSSLRLLMLVTGVTILGVMPVFLVGAFGSLIRTELAIDEAGLGLTVAVGFGASAVTSASAGRWVERVGARRVFSVALALSATALLGIAGFARSWPLLAGFAAIGGIANGLGQPASNLALAHDAPTRPALVFGAKQSGAPAATLLAGAAVSVVGATVGWRWAFVAVACAAGLLARGLPTELRDRRTTIRALGAPPDLGVSVLVALAVASGIGVAAATSLASFVVGSAVDSGIALGRAGWLLAIGSGSAIVARLALGVLADRWDHGRLLLVSGMLFTGAAGLLLLSLGGRAAITVGTVVAFSGGWGWTGLLMFATVRLNPGAPAAATGIIQAGAATGAALGPFLFGALVVGGSYVLAWRSAAAAALISSVLILAVRSRIVAVRATV